MSAPNSYDAAVRAVEGARFEIVSFSRFDEHSDSWTFIPHRHDFFELLFFLNGNAQISLSRRSLFASFSDLLLYPPQTEHTEHVQINHQPEIYCLQARVRGLEVGGVLLQQDQDQQVRGILDGLFTEYHGCRDAALEDAYLRLLARLIARRAFNESAPSHPIEYCMMYMRQNYAGEITIQQLADLIHVSRSHLNTLFTRHAEMTPMQYLQDIRIDAAKSLLMTTGHPVADIAAEVGFNSPKYFCHTFHRATGMSPREFRNAEGLSAFAGRLKDRRR